MKVEFTAPGIPKGESINSQLFFFILSPQAQKKMWMSWGLFSRFWRDFSPCWHKPQPLPRLRQGCQIPRKLGWFVSVRSEGNVCLVWNQLVSMSDPKTIPRKYGERCCKSSMHLSVAVCKTICMYIRYQGMLLLLLIFGVGVWILQVSLWCVFELLQGELWPTCLCRSRLLHRDPRTRGGMWIHSAVHSHRVGLIFKDNKLLQ